MLYYIISYWRRCLSMWSWALSCSSGRSLCWWRRWYTSVCLHCLDLVVCPWTQHCSAVCTHGMVITQITKIGPTGITWVMFYSNASQDSSILLETWFLSSSTLSLKGVYIIHHVLLFVYRCCPWQWAAHCCYPDPAVGFGYTVGCVCHYYCIVIIIIMIIILSDVSVVTIIVIVLLLESFSIFIIIIIILSAFVDNIPYTAGMVPVIIQIASQTGLPLRCM